MRPPPRGNDLVIYKTDSTLVLSSARSLFCLNIRSFGNVVAAASAPTATPTLASRQNLIFSRYFIFRLISKTRMRQFISHKIGHLKLNNFSSRLKIMVKKIFYFLLMYE